MKGDSGFTFKCINEAWHRNKNSVATARLGAGKLFSYYRTKQIVERVAFAKPDVLTVPDVQLGN